MDKLATPVTQAEEKKNKKRHNTVCVGHHYAQKKHSHDSMQCII